METGITGRQSVTVTENLTALAMGSGESAVYATPAMIALMEKTAFTSIKEQLEDGQTTVGTLINVKHLSATPVGIEVTCESKLVEVVGMRLVFELKAFDQCGCIGEGTHERFIVNGKRFLEKANGKLK